MVEGGTDNNSFTTPEIRITPEKTVNGYLERVNYGEYYALAKYSENNSVIEGIRYNIIPTATPQIVTLSVNAEQNVSHGKSTPSSEKSTVSPILGMISLGLVGISFVFFKR